MSENTEYPTGVHGDPLANREPADFEDPATFADPDALDPQGLRDDGDRPEPDFAPDVDLDDDEVDTDADPETVDPRDVR